MKRNHVRIISSVALASTMLVVSCGETEEVNTDPITDPVVEDSSPDEMSMIDEFAIDTSVIYKVPTPADLFMALDNAGATANFDYLNDAANWGNYEDKRSKAMNLGVYIADVGYAVNFNYGTDIAKYIKAVDELMKELNVTGAIDESFLNEMTSLVSSGDKDKLNEVTAEPFYKAYDYLEKNDRGAALRMVVAGGWVEGLYLLTNMVDSYDANNPVIQEVANQALTYDAVLGFMEEKGDDDDVMQTISDMFEIFDILGSLEFVESDASTSTEGGMTMLSGGDKPVISEDQFNDLKQKVADYRNSITG